MSAPLFTVNATAGETDHVLRSTARLLGWFGFQRRAAILREAAVLIDAFARAHVAAHPPTAPQAQEPTR